MAWTFTSFCRSKIFIPVKSTIFLNAKGRGYIVRVPFLCYFPPSPKKTPDFHSHEIRLWSSWITVQITENPVTNSCHRASKSPLGYLGKVIWSCPQMDAQPLHSSPIHAQPLKSSLVHAQPLQSAQSMPSQDINRDCQRWYVTKSRNPWALWILPKVQRPISLVVRQGTLGKDALFGSCFSNQICIFIL